jgi:hypothetical protein
MYCLLMPRCTTSCALMCVLLYMQVGLKRDWMPHGLFLVPTLSEKGIKGAFTLEVHSDVPVDVGELPETVSRYSTLHNTVYNTV